MPTFTVKFKGGGPTIKSNRTATYRGIEASQPWTAVAGVMRTEHSEFGMRIPKGAWLNVQVYRES